MGGGEAVMVAGIGCRKACPAEAIVALVREAGRADALAAPWFKMTSAGLLEAARILALPLRFVPEAELGWALPGPGVAYPAVAEGCAVSGGGTLVRPRIKNGAATCALGFHPNPGPLPPAGEGALIGWGGVPVGAG